MTQAKRNLASALPPYAFRALKEGAFLLLACIALYSLVSLWTYHHNDPGWSFAVINKSQVIQNAGGVFGAWLSDLLLSAFGRMTYVFPIILVYIGWLVHCWQGSCQSFAIEVFLPRMSGLFLMMLSGTTLEAMHFYDYTLPQKHSGGIVGQMIMIPMTKSIGLLGTTLLSLAVLLTAISLLTSLSWLSVMDKVGLYTLKMIAWIHYRIEIWQDQRQGIQAKTQRHQVLAEKTLHQQHKKPLAIKPQPQPIQTSERLEQEKQPPLFDEAGGLSTSPPLSLLDEPPSFDGGYTQEALTAISQQVENKFKDFNIDISVEAVLPGPVITRFELMPAPGLKVSKITNLTKDIARALSVPSVRVVEVIPGKPFVGLEIPNESRETVILGDVIKSIDYEKSPSPLSLALGKDISGNAMITDLSKMPHLLVAGTTGSGKSVAVNAMILSLLYKSTATEVRMIMIDPKMLELSIYEGIPHLLTPVVTDMKDAANALRWCVAEMERRYQLMAPLGVRNINGFNRRLNEADPKDLAVERQSDTSDQAVPDGPLQPLPFIVVVIDEFADMMMVVGKKVEELIARLSQKARAAGIHLILATQRPSVDVITGLIKANIPTRIAFQVSSKIDSRTILDQTGAEQLLGHGDMLYLPGGASLPVRIHGAFVSDEEVHKIVDHLKTRSQPDYHDEILKANHTLPGEKPGLSDDDDIESDPLYDEAVQFVLDSQRASISSVQRKFKVGYNRAARLIEQMEVSGLISPPGPGGTREILVPHHE